MAGWTLDEKRFREEVLRALEKGWSPRTNLFRCYQLPVDVSDSAVIEAALKGVRNFVNARAGMQAKRVLTAIREDAEAELRDPALRGAHRDRVLRQRAALQAALGPEVAGVGGIPQAAVAAVAARHHPRFARSEVVEVLAAMGCPVREPVALPLRGKPPTTWRMAQQELTFLGFPTLVAYLRDRFSADVAVDAGQLAARRSEIDRTASGDARTAETSVLTLVDEWVRTRQLVDLLRDELLRELSAAAALGHVELDRVLDESALAPYAQALGLPGPADLRYALLCRARWPEATGGSWEADYERARAAGDLRAAYDILGAQRTLDPRLVAARDELKAELAAVADRLAEARRLERGDAEAAAALYQEVARHDPEGAAGLRRCRPPEPRRITATVSGDRVDVSWTASAARVGDISYRVVRHVTGGGDGDGDAVADRFGDLAVADTRAPAGVPVRYAVWTLRDDNPSAAAASSEPVAVLRAVSDLELVPSESSVDVRWRLPAGAAGTRVTRCTDGAADVVGRHEGGGYRDTAVRTGVTYEYRVESEYRFADGTVRHAPAVVGRVRPEEPPRPVRDLAVAVDAEALLLSWSPPPRGEVRVLLLNRAPDVASGRAMALSGAERLGVASRPIEPPAEGRMRIGLPDGGRRRWLLPLTLVDGIAVVGDAVEYDSRLPSVADVRVERLGDRLRVSWAWPTQVSEVLVLSRPGAPPSGPDDRSATRSRLSHAAYHRSGCELPASGGEHWVGVCAGAFVEGWQVWGPMTTACARVPVEAAYEVERVRFRRARRRLVVTAAAGVGVRGVRVVARHRLPPLRPEDGEEVARFPAPDGDGPLAGEFSVPPGPRPLFLRVFPEEDDADLALVPTHPAQLRID